MRVAVSFLAGILLFLTVVLAFSGFVSSHMKPPPDTEGIISKTSIAGYPKYLDGFYFNLGSVLIPAGAWLFWLGLARKRKLPQIALIAIAWLGIVIFAVLKQ